MLRCDSARISTSVTAPFGKLTWLVSSTCPRPAVTPPTASSVGGPTSVTGDDGVSRASIAYSSFGMPASCRRSWAYLLAASMPGMVCEDTVRPGDKLDEPGPAAFGETPGHYAP